MQRINVVGVSGSGKSTFAKQLATELNIPLVEMDLLFWLPNWQEPEIPYFVDKVQQAVAAEAWVLDGNYHSKTVALKWQRADTVIWLNYSFMRTLWQVTTRCIKRAWSNKELWVGTGNKESIYRSFFTRDSVIWWMITNYHSNQRRYSEAMNSPQFAHLQFYRFTHPRQSRKFLLSLRQQQNLNSAIENN